MIVAVVAVRMVEVTVHEEVGVVAVWNRFVPAARSMGVVLRVPVAGVRWGAVSGVRAVDGEAMLVDMVAVRVVQVPIVKVVRVVAVLHGGVAAVGTVLVVMVVVDRVIVAHALPLSSISA